LVDFTDALIDLERNCDDYVKRIDSYGTDLSAAREDFKVVVLRRLLRSLSEAQEELPKKVLGVFLKRLEKMAS